MTNTNQAILITGGHLIDPANNRDGAFDLLIENGKIAAVDAPGKIPQTKATETIEAKGLLVTPGLIDIHVHLREPGFEWKETIHTGSQAAVAGGFTAICPMPNTDPINDAPEITQYMLKQAAQSGLCRVYPIGAITLGSQGEKLAPYGELLEAGCVAFSDDGKPVMSAGVMRRALDAGRMFDAVFTCHEEDKTLSDGFSMNESALSVQLGLRGMPGASEDVMISRDIELCRLTGTRLHVCHVSTARAVTLIKRAKEDGINITAETACHYFTLNESAVDNFNVNAKMSMPLRSQADVEGVMAGLAAGVLDCIASDHAPHDLDSKRKPFSEASFGILGLQTTLPLTLAKVREGKLTLHRAIEALTSKPAEMFRLPLGNLAVGKIADLTLIDEKRSYELTPEMIRSKSKNSPFIGQPLTGVAVRTILAGKTVFSIEELKS